MLHHSLRHMVLAIAITLGATAQPALTADLVLQWEPVNDDRVTGYTLYYGDSYGDYPYSIDVGNVTRHTLTNLDSDRLYYFAVKAKGLNGVESDFSAVVSTGNYRLLVGTGSDPVEGGQIHSFNMDNVLERTILTSWREYKALDGQTRIASGDIDGDERDEVIIGFGPVGLFGLPGGRFEILDDDLSHLAWGQVDWPDYNSINGETRPAIGDVDGDGKDEILIGLGEGGNALVEVFRYADGAPLHMAWTGIDWPEYSQENGETWPAAGDVNSDQRDDIAIGLGKGGGGLFVLKSGFDPDLLETEEDPWRTEVEGFLTWQEYAIEQGETRPAFGDLNGDGKPEVVVGLGKTGAGNVDVFSASATGLTYLLSAGVDWDDYNLDNGETRPVLGDIDNDARDEIIVGLGEGGRGFVDIFDDHLNGLVKISDLQIGTLAYQDRDGSTWPAYKVDRTMAAVVNPPIYFQLLVAKAGNGDGTIGGGGSYPAGTLVTPSATPDAKSTLTNWTPATCGTPFNLTADTTCTATFTLLRRNLTVATNGSGTVSSTPAGIACGTDCTEAYAIDTSVTLTAQPAAGQIFTGWSGDCTGSAGCTLSMSQDRNVAATFQATPSYALSVTRSGSGTVASTPAGINCGTDCSESYPSGTDVSLTATPATGYAFSGWSGACTGTGVCNLTMAAAKSVTATFKTLPKYTLNVRRSGSGTVTSAPKGITCGRDCTEAYYSGTVVTLNPVPAKGYKFVGWSGACTGTGTCTVTMSGAKTATATFSR